MAKPISETLLEAMARNYAGGHSWDRLDGEACMRAAAVIRRLADPASPAAAAPEPVAWLVSGGRLFVDKAFTRKTEAEIAIDKRCDDSVLVPLYTHPAPADTQPQGSNV